MTLNDNSSKESLAAVYLELIGYDPFKDDPTIKPCDVADTLSEYIKDMADRLRENDAAIKEFSE
jgi:hypothetical protein